MCPVCHADGFVVDVSPSQIDRQSELRESFVISRLGRRPRDLEAMDLTCFMHGGPGRLLSCRGCGLLFRDEQEESHYESDAYDSVLMKHLYPGYLRAFERKKPKYRPLLRPGAEVLEVGSHLGAFLQAAEEWGWCPTGLDIGEAASAFARRLGESVKRLPLEDYSPRLRRPEAIFIWNCFEQLEDPEAALKTSHQLLDRHGLLVVRVPNAEFYLRQQRELQGERPSERAVRLLGFNNLLGFPYLHGYTPKALNRLLKANRFEPVTIHNSSLLTPPYPQVSAQTCEEWRKTRREGESAPAVSGPWIEVVSRRASAN
jgi:hypothetical protein